MAVPQATLSMMSRAASAFQRSLLEGDHEADGVSASPSPGLCARGPGSKEMSRMVPGPYPSWLRASLGRCARLYSLHILLYKNYFSEKNSSGWSRRRAHSWICSLPSAWCGVLSQEQFVSSERSIPGTGAVECSVPEMWGLSPGWWWMDRRSCSPGCAGDLLFVALFFNNFLPLLVFIAHIFPVTVCLGFHPF